MGRRRSRYVHPENEKRRRLANGTQLHGAAKEAAEKVGVKKVDISISYAGDKVAAVATAHL